MASHIDFNDIPEVVLKELRDYIMGFEGEYLCTDTAELVGNAWQNIADVYDANVNTADALEILHNIGATKMAEFARITAEKFPHQFPLNHINPINEPVSWITEAIGAAVMEFMDYVFYGKDIKEDSRIRLIQTQITDEADGYLFDSADVEAVLGRMNIYKWKENCKLVKLLPTWL